MVFKLPVSGSTARVATAEALEDALNTELGALDGRITTEVSALDARTTAQEVAQADQGGRLTTAETQITALEAGQTSQQIVVSSWAELSARVGALADQGAEVDYADAGTHGAASATGYDGASVPNAGRYRWDQGWARWVWIGANGVTSRLARSGALADLDDIDAARATLRVSDLAQDSAVRTPGIVQDGIAPLGLDPQGRLSAVLSPMTVRGLGLDLARERRGLAPQPALVCWGDSLTEGSGSTSAPYRYPQALAGLLGRDVVNLGIGGQTSTQIAARQRARQITVSVTDDEIPASGSVAVTAIDPAPLTGGSSASTRTLTGTLAGIWGTLTKMGYPAVYSFQRGVAGAAVPCPAGSAFVPDVAAAYLDRTQVFWPGRNNFADMVAVIEDLVRMVARLPQLAPRYLCMTILPHEDDALGTANRPKLDALNAQLLRLFGSHVIDIASYLRDPVALAADGYICSADDLTDIGNGLTPRGLRADQLHLNDLGYPLIALQVARALRARGW